MPDHRSDPHDSPVVHQEITNGRGEVLREHYPPDPEAQPAAEVPAAETGSVIVGPDGREPYVVIEIGTGKITHVAAGGARTVLTRERIEAAKAAWQVIVKALRPVLRGIDAEAPAADPEASELDVAEITPSARLAFYGNSADAEHPYRLRLVDAVNPRRAVDLILSDDVADILRESLRDEDEAATPPGRSADEVREAIGRALRPTLAGEFDTMEIDDIADALMDRVVGPLIAERDRLRQVETQAGWDIATLHHVERERDELRRHDAWLADLLSDENDGRHVVAELDRLRAAVDEQRQRAERAVTAREDMSAHVKELDRELARMDGERREQRQRAEQLRMQVLDLTAAYEIAKDQRDAERATIQRIWDAVRATGDLDLIQRIGEEIETRADVADGRAALARQDAADTIANLRTELDKAKRHLAALGGAVTRVWRLPARSSHGSVEGYVLKADVLAALDSTNQEATDE